MLKKFIYISLMYSINYAQASYSYLVPSNGNQVVIDGKATSLTDVTIPQLISQVRCEPGNSGTWNGSLMYQFKSILPVTSSNGSHKIQITPTYSISVTPANTVRGFWNSWGRYNNYSIDCSAAVGSTTWASDIQDAFQTVSGTYTGPAGTQVIIPKTLIGYYGYVVTDSTSEPTPVSFDTSKAVYSVYISGSFTVPASCTVNKQNIDIPLGIIDPSTFSYKITNNPLIITCNRETAAKVNWIGCSNINKGICDKKTAMV